MEILLYRVTGYFKDQKIVRYFIDVYDAIDFKDTVDAHYPLKVTFKKGVYPMRSFVLDSWNTVMNLKYNPLKNIPDTSTRHMIMQVLAWMWCIVFGFIVSSWTIFGVSAIIHMVLLGAIAVTVGTFEIAKRNPQLFNLRPGYHSVSRTRGNMWINGQRVELDPRDPGGEHE
jgi:hypothetical protein